MGGETLQISGKSNPVAANKPAPRTSLFFRKILQKPANFAFYSFVSILLALAAKEAYSSEIFGINCSQTKSKISFAQNSGQQKRSNTYKQDEFINGERWRQDGDSSHYNMNQDVQVEKDGNTVKGQKKGANDKPNEDIQNQQNSKETAKNNGDGEDPGVLGKCGLVILAIWVGLWLLGKILRGGSGSSGNRDKANWINSTKTRHDNAG